MFYIAGELIDCNYMQLHLPFFICSLILFSTLEACNTPKSGRKHFYFVEPFKEQEIWLQLGDGNTFILSDLTGCNQFSYTGKYTKGADFFSTYYILNLPDSGQEGADDLLPINSGDVFKINSGDTAWILNEERLVLQAKSFKASRNANLNLRKIRVAKLEEFYIDQLGRKGFIQALGEGKSVKVARRNLMKCSMPHNDVKLLR